MRSGTTGLKHFHEEQSTLGRNVARGSVATDAVVGLSDKSNP